MPPLRWSLFCTFIFSFWRCSSGTNLVACELSALHVWGLALGVTGDSIEIFFLACVTLAGIFGAAMANRKILWVQAVPGVIALALVWFS
jgi:uncharacterized membrane protein